MKHDKELLLHRFGQHLYTYDKLAAVQRRIAGRLAGRLRSHLPDPAPQYGIEIGAGTGFLTRHLLELSPGTQWLVNDLVPRSAEFLPASDNLRFEAGDGEHLSLTPDGNRPGIIASASTVQWFDDPRTFLRRAAEALAEDGLLALATFGPDNFREITATTGEGLEYPALTRLRTWLVASGITPVVIEEWTERLTFERPIDVLHHLRLTGVNAITPVHWTPSRLRRFESDYSDRFSTPDKSVTLTFHPIIVIGQKEPR